METTQLYTNSLWNKITEKAYQNHRKVVLKDTNGNERTYGAFVNNVTNFSLLLIKKGVQRGDKVLFLERPSIRAVEIFFAIYRVGAIAVIADPAMGRENFKSRVNFSECKYVVLDPALNFIRYIPGMSSFLRKFYSSIPDLAIKLPKIIRLPLQIKSSKQTYTELQIEDDADALIIFTSGTTSEPKGVVHTFGSLKSTLELIQDKINTGNGDIFLTSQLHFSIIALITGATAIIDTSTKFNASKYISNTIRLKPTHTFILPAEGQQIISLISSSERTLPTTLKCIMFGSAPVLVGFLDHFSKVASANTEILCIYGGTEILPVCMADIREKLAYQGRGDYLGTPLPGVTINIEEGEFLVSGPNLCSRYLHEKDTLHHFSSGDLGFVTKNGKIVLTGRKKDMIIKDHNNVYPALFEPTISKIKGVKNCAFVGIYSELKNDEEIHLCVEINHEAIQSDAEFIKYLNKEIRSGEHSIDSYAFPDKIHIMELPLSGRSHKIDKSRLRKIISRVI
jgi:acyl-CoA synthetase (AMP-forming)/AMP-acid ligase II